MSNLYNYKLSYQSDLFEVNVYEVSEKTKEFPTIVEEVKYNGEVVHIYVHNTKSKQHAKALATERLEACKPPLVLAYTLLKFACKCERADLVKAGRQYMECAI